MTLQKQLDILRKGLDTFEKDHYVFKQKFSCF